MKKIVLAIPASFLMTLAIAQQTDAKDASRTLIPSDKASIKQSEAMKNRNISDDKLDILEITGLGGTSFSTMNYPESVRAAGSSLKISQGLLTGSNKATGYQLVFTGENEKRPLAVETQNGVTSIFYTMDIYQVVMQKLEQAITNKKKVQLKITQNKDGYREGVLVF